MKNTVLKWINTAFFAAMILVNALANLLPLGLGTTGAISGKYPNLFTPAPVTFTIWGIIYLLMAVFIFYQWKEPDGEGESESLRQRIGLLFPLGCALNIAWIFTWHFDAIGWSVLCIVGLLATLAVTAMRIPRRTNEKRLRALVRIGFDVYFGWLIAATIANISVFLVKLGWNGFGIPETVWTVMILLVGACIGAAPAYLQRRWFTTITVVWAYAGILARHVAADGLTGKYPVVITAAIIGIIFLLLAMLMKLLCETCLPGEKRWEEVEDGKRL